MDKLNGKTANIIKENMEKLKEIFPEAFTEDKIDFEMLRRVLGDEVETEQERYKFTWNGKSEAVKIALKQSTGTLRPDKKSSKNWDETQNLYIEGDNLEVLRLLQTTYRSKVKMIYIDPPYNTGKDFVYSDKFNDTVDDYKERVGDKYKTNVNTSGRYHTNWLNMMYPRLRLAKNLLKDDGVIFISIDDNEVHNLRKICDEIFGEDNFVVSVIWEKKFSPQNDAKYFSHNHDYILCFAKDLNKFSRNLLPITEEQESRYSNPDNDPRGPWTSGDLTVSRYTEKDIYEITTPGGRKITPTTGRSWRTSKNKIEGLIKDNRVWFGEDGNNMPRLKRFLSEIQQGKVPISIFYHKEVGHTQKATQDLTELFDGKKYFDYPKSIPLIKRLLVLSSSSDDIILDFFAGSGTTGHAVMELNAEDGGNRKFIMAQLPEKTDEQSEAYKAGYKDIAEIGRERIRRAGEKIKEENKEKLSEREKPLDIGFKSFTLDTTNLTIWDEKTEDMEQTLLDNIDAIKSDRSQEDVLYEVFLKYGIDLATPVETEEFEGKTLYKVSGGYLTVCLDEDLDISFIEKLAERKPNRLVFRDKGFKDDTVKVNAEMTLKKHGVTDIKVL